MNQDWLVEIEQRHLAPDKIQGKTFYPGHEIADLDVVVQAYKHLRKAIEEAPHDDDCGIMWHPRSAYSGPCDCFKSQTLNYNPTEVI